VLFAAAGVTVEEDNQNMDMVDTALWVIAGISFVFVAFGCWVTRPAR
jgi:hypothetical protein